VGGRTQNFDEAHQNAIDVLEHLIVPETHHPIAARRKPGIAHTVSIDVVTMLSTIDLNDELRVEAREVDDVMTNRYLSAKSKAFNLSLPNAMPERAFGIGHVTAQVSRITVWHSTKFAEHPVPATPPTLPSPSRGEGKEGLMVNQLIFDERTSPHIRSGPTAQP
jgi:hypothetical protein